MWWTRTDFVVCVDVVDAPVVVVVVVAEIVIVRCSYGARKEESTLTDEEIVN